MRPPSTPVASMKETVRTVVPSTASVVSHGRRSKGSAV